MPRHPYSKTEDVSFAAGKYIPTINCLAVRCKSAGFLKVHFPHDHAARQVIVQIDRANETEDLPVDCIYESGTTIPAANILLLGEPKS